MVKLIKHSPKSLLIELEIEKGEAKIIWMALQKQAEASPDAGSIWQDVIANTIDLFHKVEEKFDE